MLMFTFWCTAQYQCVSALPTNMSLLVAAVLACSNNYINNNKLYQLRYMWERVTWRIGRAPECHVNHAGVPGSNPADLTLAFEINILASFLSMWLPDHLMAAWSTRVETSVSAVISAGPVATDPCALQLFKKNCRSSQA